MTAETFDWKNPDYDSILTDRIARIERMREEPGLVAGVRAHYAENPVAFIDDWAMTFDPRNAALGRPATVPFVLFPRQREFIQWLHEHWRNRRHGLVEKSRDMGATWLCVWFAIWMWNFHPGAVVGFGSRKEDYVDKTGDPDAIFWKLREGLRLLPIELLPAGFDLKEHAPYMRIVNPQTGATIKGEAGDNIGRGGRTSIYFVDEAAYIERPHLIEASLSQTTNCRIDVSTPFGMANPFAVKRHSGRIDVFTLHWTQDPRKGPEWYARQKEELDPVILAQEVDINYQASVTNTLLDSEAIAEAMLRGPADVAAVGPLVLSVDVARFGHCETVVTLRRGRVVFWQRAYKRMDTQDVAGLVRAEVESIGAGKVAQIAVDDIGVGGGVTDTLRRWYGKRVVAVNASLRVQDGLNFNVRAQMYHNLALWLRDGPVSLPNDPELRNQLGAITYTFRGGLRLIVSKKELDTKGLADPMNRSPDRADSLALSFAVAPAEPEEDDIVVTDGFGVLDPVAGY